MKELKKSIEKEAILFFSPSVIGKIEGN